jgi:hypothetical protein
MINLTSKINVYIRDILTRNMKQRKFPTVKKELLFISCLLLQKKKVHFISEKRRKIRMRSSRHVRVDGVRLCLWSAATNGPTVHSQIMYKYGEPRWNYMTRKKRKNRRKACSTLSATNLTRTDPGMNQGFRGKRPATNRLTHSTALSSCYGNIPPI